MWMIIWLYEKKYDKIIPLIGGFHTLLVYLKILFKKYGCLGLQQWWVVANAIQQGSVSQAIEGRHYRGICLHKQSFNVLLRNKIERKLPKDENMKQLISNLRYNTNPENLESLVKLDSFKTYCSDLLASEKDTQSQYITDVSVLLALVSAVREKSVELYIAAERALLPKCFTTQMFYYPNVLLPKCFTTQMHYHPNALPPKCITTQMHYYPNVLPPKCITTQMFCYPNALLPKCFTTQMFYYPNALPPKCITTQMHYYPNALLPKCFTTQMHYYPNVLLPKCITTQMFYYANVLLPKCFATQMHYYPNVLPPKCFTTQMHYHPNALPPKRITTQMHYYPNVLLPKCITTQMFYYPNVLLPKCITTQMHYYPNALLPKCFATQMFCYPNVLLPKCFTTQMFCYPNALLPKCFASNHINYARYLTIQHDNFEKIQIEKPTAWEHLLNVGFGGSITGQSFSTIHGDLITETTINREVKVRGGPMRGGYSTSFEANDAFIKTSHLMAKIRGKLKEKLNVLSSTVHKEVTPAARSRHDTIVNRLEVTLKDYFDPFVDGPARHFATGVEIDGNITYSLLNSDDIGEVSLAKFLKDLSMKTNDDRMSIFDSITKSKIKTGMEKEKKESRKLDILKEDKQLVTFLPQQRH